MWAPEIATHYGEVFWTDQGNNAIPKDIVARFAGKTMAIMGYEQDQVRVCIGCTRVFICMDVCACRHTHL